MKDERYWADWLQGAGGTLIILGSVGLGVCAAAALADHLPPFHITPLSVVITAIGAGLMLYAGGRWLGKRR